MQTDTYIPRRLDDQWKLGFWDIDVAAPVLLLGLLGYLSSSKLAFFACVGIGVSLSRMLIRIKADKHPSFALHWAYWALPENPLSAMQRTPPSCHRRMVG
jgi:conjugal transfer pilus assembly protein TraL